MKENELPQRDSKGDIKFNVGKADWDKIRGSQYTYIFHYYDEKKDHYFPYFRPISISKFFMVKYLNSKLPLIF